MLSRATGLFSIYRGTTTNDSGDETDGAYLVATSIGLSLRNTTTSGESLTTDTPRQISRLAGRAPAGTDLRQFDRIQNQTTSEYFQVDWVREPASSTGNSDLAFGAHRVS